MNTDDIPHVDAKEQDEEQANAFSCLHERPVEVHRPKLGLDLHLWKLGVGPLYDEISQDLGLDGFTWCVCKSLTHELDRPFGDPPSGLPVLDDLA